MNRCSCGSVTPSSLPDTGPRTVITGNEYLGEWALRHNDNVWVLPSPIDSDRFTPRSALGDGRLLVWSGLSRHLDDLLPIRPALRHLAGKYPGLTLRVISDAAPREDLGVPVQFVRWSPETEVEALRACDIGIMPLKDDDWTKGKAGFKVLQYMAAGLPVVANPVGVHSEMIVPGVNGLLPVSEDEWIESVRFLATEPDLRAEMGRASRRRAQADYSVSAWADRWADLILGPGPIESPAPASSGATAPAPHLPGPGTRVARHHLGGGPP